MSDSFTKPMPFHEALDAADVKSLLPTTGDSAALRQLAPDIKRRAWMSATVSNLKFLAGIRDGTGELLKGQSDQATVRLGLKNILRDMGYVPDPDHAGGLQDLGSDRRLNLIIETNAQTAQGFGWFAQGNQEDVLDQWPAQELYRALVPKGGVPAERDWAERWEAAGGEFIGDRMVALKTDPVWEKLGSSALFPDGLDNPWPPFAFNSGMDVRDVDRAEAEQLGLLEPSTTLFPRKVDFNADLAGTPELRQEWLREAITDSGLGKFVHGVLQFLDDGGAS